MSPRRAGTSGETATLVSFRIDAAWVRSRRIAQYGGYGWSVITFRGNPIGKPGRQGGSEVKATSGNIPPKRRRNPGDRAKTKSTHQVAPAL